MCIVIEETLLSDFNLLKDDLCRMLDILRENIEQDDLMFNTKLILDELITNSIIHGNRGNKEKKVSVYIKISAKAIRIEVSDEGDGVDYNPEAYDPTQLTCGGRGLKIVHSLSDEFLIRENSVISIQSIEGV